MLSRSQAQRVVLLLTAPRCTLMLSRRICGEARQSIAHVWHALDHQAEDFQGGELQGPKVVQVEKLNKICIWDTK